MKTITKDGIEYVLIPKNEYEDGKFFNRDELYELQQGISAIKIKMNKFIEGLKNERN